MSKTPKLRFKEFSGDWEEKKLRDIIDYKKGYAFKSNNYKNKGVRIIKISDTSATSIKDEDITCISKEEAYCYKEWELKANDIIVSTVGSRPPLYSSMVGKIILIPKHCEGTLLNQNLVRLRTNQLSTQGYLYNYLNSKRYLNYIEGIYRGNANQVSITLEDLFEYKVRLPKVKEQEKIASLFSLIDEKIYLQDEKLKMLKDYKKGMMQKIFSRELRFKYDDGRDYPEWKDGKVKDVISEKLYPVEKPRDAYWRLGLRSHGKGTFHEYVTDPSKISMDKLYEVKRNMLIVNITFAWEHAIAITDDIDEGKLVSHRFPTYDFNENAIHDFYKYYILLPKFKYSLLNASPGGAGRNRVLNKKQFLEIYVPIPCVEEQKKIAKLLKQLDQKIEKEQEKLDSLNGYKKGLLQQMFV